MHQDTPDPPAPDGMFTLITQDEKDIATRRLCQAVTYAMDVGHTKIHTLRTVVTVLVDTPFHPECHEDCQLPCDCNWPDESCAMLTPTD